MGAQVNFHILYFASFVAVALSNVQQCDFGEPRPHTVYTVDKRAATLGCASPYRGPSYWICTKYDADGRLMMRETLPTTPQNRSLLTYDAPEASVYELRQIAPWRVPSNCLCIFDVRITVSASIESAILDHRYERAVAASVSPSPSAVSAMESTLQTWEVALISVNIIVLVIAACIVMACGVTLVALRRRTNHTHSRLHEEEEEGEQELEHKCEDETQGDSFLKEIELSSVVFEELLHKGTFKLVHKASIGTMEVAVKRLRDQSSELGLHELKNEEDMLKEIGGHAGGHPNIMSLHPMQVKNCPSYLLLEYAPFGTMDKFLLALKAGFVPDWYMQLIQESTENSYSSHVAKDLMNTAVQIAEAMRFLSMRGLVHKDLSTRNTFIYSDFVVKIGNFGQEHEGNYYLVTERGHFLQDMAPECIWNKEYSIKSDVWSFGILLYKLGTLEGVPFSGVEPAHIHRQMEEGRRPSKLPCFSKKFFFTIQQCWYFTPAERPDFVALLNTLNGLRESPSQHIILRTFDNTAALGIPVQDTSHDQESQRRGSAHSSRADGTMGTVRTAETIVDMLSDEEEQEQDPDQEESEDEDEDEEEEEDEPEEEEKGEEEEGEEEEEEGKEEEGSLGPPMLKKLCTVPSGHTKPKQPSSLQMSTQRSSISSGDAITKLVLDKHTQHHSIALTTSRSESESDTEGKSQKGNAITYRPSWKRKPDDDLNISQAYADLISKLASPGPSYL